MGYSIEAFLGQGSYGAVIKARRQGRHFAIKALANNNEPAGESLLHYQLEAEILRRITHSRIPGLVETFSSGNTHYIVQEFIEGMPLCCLMDTGYRFSEAEVKGIIMQLLSILHDLHCPFQKENAVVHRDLRLSNLLFHNGKVYVIDFGLARFLDPSQFAFYPEPQGIDAVDSSAPAVMLTYQFSEPGPTRKPGTETYRIMRREVSPHSDLFGTGVIAVDLFTNWVEDESLFKLPWEEVLPISVPFVDFLQKLLSREKGFATAAEAMGYLGNQMTETKQ